MLLDSRMTAMTRIGRAGLGLVLAATALAAAPAGPKPGAGKAYDVLGDLPVLDTRGRVKPLHTKATDTVKEIYSRSTIKLPDPDGETTTPWPAVAAYVDWSARPEFWNEQPFILVEYHPLKQKLLTTTIRGKLEVLASKLTGSAKATADALVKQEGYVPADLNKLALDPSLTKDQKAEVIALAERLGEDRKWLSPEELENADVMVDGKSMSFLGWFRDVLGKQRAARGMWGGEAKLTQLEKHVAEVGKRLFTYIAVRDRNRQGEDAFELGLLPRPVGPTYMNATADAIRKAQKGGLEGLDPVETDLAQTWFSYVRDIQQKNRHLPGEDKTFDTRFAGWLEETAPWFPLRLTVGADAEALAKAGFPKDKADAFLKAMRAVDEDEKAHPGQLDEAKARTFVAATRAMAVDRPLYPTSSAMARESHFNRLAPFYRAPYLYGLALIALLLGIGITADRKSAVGRLGTGLYAVGLTAFVGGILLEMYGFYLRVRISGWAPVTNMYETVIWVALVTTVLGLVLELVYRKRYAALAASGVAMLATLLAANVPLLDGNIGTLPPVLRDNFWLSIHVLTIVSSYAAFALAMGLGLIGSGYYLTATYRRSAGYGRLALPLLLGVPLLAFGAIGVYGGNVGWAPGVLDAYRIYTALGVVALLGIAATFSGVFATFGELANRSPGRAGALGVTTILAGVGGLAVESMGGLSDLSDMLLLYAAGGLIVLGLGFVMLAILALEPQAALRARTKELVAFDRSATQATSAVEGRAEAAVGHASAAGGGSTTATVARPSVAEIRARSRAERGGFFDPRTVAMQETASRIKPLSNYVYRAMQVGVLLVAAGTILGGVWADYSWGRFWGWDPKEVWALITLLVYLVPLHGRFAGWVNTFWLTVSSVACFSSVLMAWYGVNFVLGVGLHSYGFTEGGGQGIVFATSAAVLGLVFGTAWRRYCSSELSASTVPAA